MSTLTLRLDPAIAARRKTARAAADHPNLDGPPTAPAAAPPALTTQAVAASLSTKAVANRDSPPPIPSGKALKRQRLKDLRAKLKATWPHLFERAVPLAVGIKREIAKHLLPEEVKLLPAIMHSWCGRPAYLKALLADGAMRHDLDGELSYISAGDVAYARERLGVST